MAEHIDIIVGAPVCRRKEYVLDRFLFNQQEIQRVYPSCMLLMATDELDYIDELRQQFSVYDLKCDVISYTTIRPPRSESRLPNITCGREALRRYVLAYGAEYFLSVDNDIIFDPSMVKVLKEQIRGYDAVYNGGVLAPHGYVGFSNGCLMIHRDTLGRMEFKHFEYANGQAIDESETVDWLLYKSKARVRKGFFVASRHYTERERYYPFEACEMTAFQKFSNIPLLRFLLTQMSINLRLNIARILQSIFYRGRKTREG
jgi:hypothetical protein